MFQDILKALKNEIKNIIFKSWYHFIRFCGLLIIPLIYGFSYIFAFYDPFPNINNLQISVITDDEKTDPFGYAIGHALQKTSIKIGETKMNLEMDHIYDLRNKTTDTSHNSSSSEIDKTIESKVKEIQKKSYATIELRGGVDSNGKSATLTDIISPIIIDGVRNKYFSLASLVNALEKANYSHLSMSPNFKKNYLIAFGFNVGSSMQGTYVTAIKEAVEILDDSNTNKDIVEARKSIKTKLQNDGLTNDEWNTLQGIIHTFKNNVGSNANKINPVTLKTQFGEQDGNKYGYGLAPFFISVAMWVGGMVMTFAVHRKIYDKSVTPNHRYFAKWILIISGSIIQATILMLSLYIIGFDDLGIGHWGAMYGFTIIIGIIFASITQAIRFTIHSRNLGIFLTIFILVLQMVSPGGLFPIETQSGFYVFLNKILPMSKSVTLIRETAFATNWGNVFAQLGYLLIYLLIVPFAIVANHRRTLSIYKKMGFELPKGIEYKPTRKKRKIKKGKEGT